MRIQAIIWSAATAYFVGIGLVYLAMSREAAGVTLLLIASGFGGLVAGWLWHWRRSELTPAEDRDDADPTESAGLVGTYPTASLRPLGIAIGMTGIVLGVAVGLWMTLAAVAALGSQVALLVRDADR